MHTLSLNSAWEVTDLPLTVDGDKGLRKIRQTSTGWLAATVPGEIHLDLIKAGRMEEPLYSDNSLKSRWPEERSWWYRTTFDVPTAFLEEERKRLVFDGIDYFAQVFLNGELLGESENAFIPAVFDLRLRLKPTANQLVVRVTCGTERIPEPDRTNWMGSLEKNPIHGPRTLYGKRWLRKPQFSYGWDWVDCLPNIGLWRGVRLEGCSHAAIDELRVDTLKHGESVFLETETVVTNLHPTAGREGTLELTITPPTGRAIVERMPLQLQPGRNSVKRLLKIAAPQWWWPVGMGKQPLYTVRARLLEGKTVRSVKPLTIGLRTVEIDRSRRGKGTRFAIRVNGQDVFCKGGNWIPADAILARVTEKKYDQLTDQALAANMNMLRVWGGGIYEDPSFYEACDRKGILIWQDFMYACANYPDFDESFRRQVRDEAEAAVRRLRHHPSIVLWCGNNEILSGTADWWNGGRNFFTDPAYDTAGIRVYTEILPEVVRLLDPHRPWWCSSPSGNGHPDSELHGDKHWWGATMSPDVQRRIDAEVYDECESGFVSEFGIIGPMDEASYRQSLRPEEMVVDHPVFQRHTNEFDKKTTPEALRKHYADPEALTLKQWILYGQLFQSRLYQGAMEALRFRKGDPRVDCQGALIWMFADCWGETGWTILDYFLRRKASFYGFRRACEPVKAIVRRRAETLVTRVVSDMPEAQSITVHHGWLRLDGQQRKVKSHKLTVPANGMVEVARTDIPAQSKQSAHEWLYAAWIDDRQMASSPSVWLGTDVRKLALAPPVFNVTAKGRELTLTSSVYCHAVHLPDQGKAVLSDNYFDLLPGVEHHVDRVDGKGAKGLNFRAVLPK